MDTDRDLLTRSAAGDSGAFESFVKRHQASVFRVLQAIASSNADAEDALQETFLAAWRSARTFRGGESARAWVLTIARNAVHRQRRRRAGEPAEFLSLDDLAFKAGWGASASDPRISTLEDRTTLERALNRLAIDDREILILRDLEGFSGDEVADVLGLSLAAMKSRLHRARLRLAGSLREESHG